MRVRQIALKRYIESWKYYQEFLAMCEEM
ncbi:DUF2972 domain-containing protein, partial [Helicobacter ganmani]